MEKLATGNLKISWEDFEAISEGWCLDSDEAHDWKYEITHREKHHRHNMEYITFVFSYEDKWWEGQFMQDSEWGNEKESIECFEVEPYYVSVIKWKRTE